IECLSGLPDLTEIIFFFDGDEAGKAGVEKLAEKLKTETRAIISYINTPEGEDINSLLQSHEPAIDAHLLEQRKPLSGTRTGNQEQELKQEAKAPSCSSHAPQNPGSSPLNATTPDEGPYTTAHLVI